MNIKCTECKKNIIDDVAYMDWLALVNYFEHEYDESEITQQTFERMYDRLMTLKPPMAE